MKVKGEGREISGKGHLQGFEVMKCFRTRTYAVIHKNKKPFMSSPRESVDHGGQKSPPVVKYFWLIFSETPSLCVGLDMLCARQWWRFSALSAFSVEIRESGMVGDYTSKPI